MPDEENLTPSESVDETGNPSTSEPQVVDSTQSSESGEQQSSPSADLAQPASEPSEELDWNGNVDELPKQLQSRGRSMLRHMHKVTQEAAQQSKQAQAEIGESGYQEYLKQRQQPAAPASQEKPFEVSQAEWEAAQTDPQAFTGVVNKAVQAQLEQASKQIMPVINDLRQKQSLQDNEREIEVYAQRHPDFWDINPIIMQAAFQQEIVKKKGSIEDAHRVAKDLEKQYLDKAQTQMQSKIAEKKKAVTASPSKSEEIKTVFVDTEREATKLAFENARLGKRQDVRVKKKKK